MKYGNLTVLEFQGRYRICRCDCGTIKRVRIDHLKDGAIISCGCIGKKNSALAKTKHGMSQTRVFKIWIGMLDRCKNDRQGNYGKRGIIVCQKWKESFEEFYKDMGEPPSKKHSIDRVNVNGNYEPGNCKWSTRTEQARNTTRNTLLTLGNHTATIAEWTDITRIKQSTICVRLYTLGWSVEDALTIPTGQKGKLHQGVIQ